MNKKRQSNTGIVIRFAGMGVIVFALPFFTLNPQNILALISLVFGNFLLAIGGALS